jgi:hypothetical protein
MRQPLAVLLAAAGPDLHGFLATDVNVVNGATKLELSADAFDPSEQRDPRPEPTRSDVRMTNAVRSDRHMPDIDLEFEGGPQLDLEALAASAFLLSALDARPGGHSLTERLMTETTRSAALSRLREVLDEIGSKHPDLNTAAFEALSAANERDIPSWLASALAELPPWDQRWPTTVQRVWFVLSKGGHDDTVPLPITGVGEEATAGAFLGSTTLVPLSTDRLIITVGPDRQAGPEPENVTSLTRLFGEFYQADDLDGSLARLIQRIYPDGLRQNPVDDSPRLPAEIEARTRLNSPRTDGVHPPLSWSAFATLINRANDGVLVFTPATGDRDLAAYVPDGSRIRRVAMGPNRKAKAVVWTPPPDRAAKRVPSMGLVLNPCADMRFGNHLCTWRNFD